MKTLKHLLFALISLFAPTSFSAQSMNCDWFTITGMEPDSLDVNNTLINIAMAGDFSSFANYPYIASVTNCIGDTVATGNMFFFGQMGGTSQGYPVSLIQPDVCLPLTVEFIYGNDNFESDTCFLTFGENELCPLFSITGMTTDILDPANSIIEIQMDGDFTDFANYPFISSVTDCNGDTISTGSMFFFGQMGGTEQGYPVSAIPVDACFPLQVEFVYGDDMLENDTCYFSLDGNMLSLDAKAFSAFHVYPNPTSDKFQIASEIEMIHESFELFNSTGQQLKTGTLNGRTTQVDVSDLPHGIYLLHINGASRAIMVE